MFNGQRVSFGEDDKVMEMDGGDDFPTVGMYLMSQHGKMVKMVHFVMYILPQFKKIITTKEQQQNNLHPNSQLFTPAPVIIPQ